MEKFKERLYYYFLNRKLKKLNRNKARTTLTTAKNIGILFNGSNIKQRKTILKYIDSFRKNGKTIKVLGFMDGDHECEKFSFPCFNKKDIDWFFRPKGRIVEDFLNSRFDIFLCLDINPDLTLQYIAALTNSSLRIGPLIENKECFDVFLDLKGNTNPSAFFKEMNFYLDKINRPKEYGSTI